MRRHLALATLALSAAALSPLARPLTAQRLGPPMSRPKLRDVTDTNDAHAYYNAGLSNFRNDPFYAGAAFYWAARIDPGWGDPLYARKAAILAQKQNLLAAMMNGSSRRSRSKELQALDSLQARALMLNPFMFRRLDEQLFTTYLTGGDRTANLSFEISTWMAQAPPATRGWYAYSLGQFDRALKFYADAIDREREKAWLHLERARILGMRNDVDNAVSEFTLALDELRKKDDKSLVVLYDSKAQAEFSMAVLLEGDGKTDLAREAYGRALQEDLAYYPAHMRLGLLALGQGDTTVAVSELALAAQIATGEPFIRYMNGYVLGAANKPEEAIVELKKAIELEPYYALPNLVLGTQYEVLGKGPEALAAYERFLATASKQAPQRTFAEKRIEDIKEFLKAPNTQ
jgi:tetratricopeptide (TPR) repeat protein